MRKASSSLLLLAVLGCSVAPASDPALVGALDRKIEELKAEKLELERDVALLKARNDRHERSNVTVVPGGDGVCWVLCKDGRQTVKPGFEFDRYVLGCYRVKPGGRELEVVGIREISYDVKAVGYRAGSPSPAEFLKSLLKK